MDITDDFKIQPIPDLPSQIQEAAEHGELVVFIGAGCSCLLGYPNWKEYSNEALTQILGEKTSCKFQEFDARVKLSIASEMESNNKKAIDYKKILAANNDAETNIKRKRLNNALLKLTNHFVTTNYDRELDMMISNSPARREILDDITPYDTQKYTAKIILSPSECLFSSIGYKGGVVFHIHGSVEKPETMVQTLKDYISLYHVRQAEECDSDSNGITYFLEQLSHSHFTVLFLGYGLNEMEILEYILSKSTAVKNNSKTPKLFLLKDFDSQHEKELAKYLRIYYKNHCGVELIPFINNNTKDQLLNVLESFAARINKRLNKLVNVRQLNYVLTNTTLPNREAEFARLMAHSGYFEQLEGYERILKESNSECYFEHLHANKLFSIDFIPRLKKEKTKDGSISYRSQVWPAQEYLINVSSCRDKNKVQAIIKIISDVSLYSLDHEDEYSYTHLFAGFAAMYANMSLSMLTMKALDICDIWLKTKTRNTLSVNIIFKNLILNFLKGNDSRNHRKACRLLKILTQLYWIEIKNLDCRMQPKTYMEEYWFNAHIKQTARLLGIKAGIAAAKIFLDRLREASKYDRKGSLSIIWRPAIEDHLQNEHKDKIIGTLVVGLRDCLCGSVEKQREETKHFLKKLLTHESIIIRRVALSVIDSNWSLLKDICDEVINSGLFERYLHHETYTFLSNHFSSFSIEQQSMLLEKLSNIERDDEEDLERTQYIFLNAIYGKGSISADKWYRMLESKHKYVIQEHPDFIFYMGTRWLKGTERTPYREEDLLSFISNNCLIEKLNGFIPDIDDGWQSPKIDDLTTMLIKTIENNPIVFIPYISKFKKANIPFQYALIRAFYSLWIKNTLEELQWQRVWEEMMLLFISIIDNEEIWDDRDIDKDRFNLIPQKSWLLNSVIDLLKAGVENDEHAYPERFLSQGFCLLNVFLNKMKRNEYCPDTIEEINDVFGTAINSLEGKVFETVIYQLLRECRLAKNDSDITVIWGKYRQLFENEFLPERGPNYIFYNIFICYFAHLYCYVDAVWTEKKLKIIFSETQDEKVFLCALDGLKYTNFTTGNFNLLKKTQVWDKSTELTIPDINVRQMIYEWLGWAYLTGIEKINDPYLKKLYDRSDIEALSTITNQFYCEINNDEKAEFRERVLAFWRYTVMWLKSAKFENAYKLVSALCTLYVYLERIDCENKEAFVFLMTQRQNDDFMTDFIWEEVSRLFDIPENQDVVISTLLSMSLNNEIDYDNTIHNLIEKIGIANRIAARDIAEKLGYTELYLKFSQ